MRIKFKGAEKHQYDTSVTLKGWHDVYSKNDKYLDYEFYDVPKIVDLYKVNPETERLEFERCAFDGEASHMVNNGKRNYAKKPHDESRLDEYLMPVDQDFFKKESTKPKTKKAKAIPSKNVAKSKVMKILDVISNNKLIAGLILLLIAALLKTDKVKDWINNILESF